MFSSRTLQAFQLLSRILRRTPLRRIHWITRLHSKLFSALPRPTYVRSRGFTLKVDPRDQLIAKKLILYSTFEGYLGNVLLSLAMPGTAVIDVGANIGIHTIPLARRIGDAGRVVAFEPDPDNFALLLENLQGNGIYNVTPRNVALSTYSGKALLYQSVVNRGALSLHPDNVQLPDDTLPPITVQVATGDEILATLDRPISLIKVDVEGAEPAVLEGLRDTYHKNTEAILVFEFYPPYIVNFGVDPLKFLQHLEKTERFHLSMIREEDHRVDPATAHAIFAEATATHRTLNLIAHRMSHDSLLLPS